jgi:hypothetical protein
VLVMTLEVWPGGVPTRRERVGQIRWANQTGGYSSTYRAVLLGRDGEVVKTLDVAHVRADGAWDLTRQTLTKMLPLPAAPPEHAGALR